MQVDVNFVYTFMSQNIKSNAVLFIFVLGGGGGGGVGMLMKFKSSRLHMSNQK